MTDPIVSLLIAALLVGAFAFLGEILTLRISRSVFEWNESFLIGAATCAALLFPLSVVAPRHALDIVAGLIVLGAVASGGRRLARGTPTDGSIKEHGDLSAVRRDGIAILLLAAIVSVSLFFLVLNHWYGHSWDAVQVWGTKAKLLYFEGGLSRKWFPEDTYDARLLSYPAFISFLEALFGRVRGTFDLDGAKAIFPFFHVSLLLATYAAARALTTVRWALGMVLLVALLPELTTRSAAGGYVDMPLAAFVAAIAGAGLRADEGEAERRALPWLIGGMTALKQEGMLLALVACGAIALAWVAERPRQIGKRARSNWPGAVLILVFVAARVSYVRWIGIHDSTWGPFDAAHRARALKNVVLVTKLCLRYLLDRGTWGLFWPAFFVAAVLTVGAAISRPAILALAIAGAVAVEGGLFLFTNWDFELHIEGAYTRLLAQLAPAAAVVIGAAGQRLWSPPPSEAT